MAEDDIYGSKAKYEFFKENLDSVLMESSDLHRRGGQKYFCKNQLNLQHFRTLLTHFEANDLSYIPPTPSLAEHASDLSPDCEKPSRVHQRGHQRHDGSDA